MEQVLQSDHSPGYHYTYTCSVSCMKNTKQQYLNSNDYLNYTNFHRSLCNKKLETYTCEVLIPVHKATKYGIYDMRCGTPDVLVKFKTRFSGAGTGVGSIPYTFNLRLDSAKNSRSTCNVFKGSADVP